MLSFLCLVSWKYRRDPESHSYSLMQFHVTHFYFSEESISLEPEDSAQVPRILSPRPAESYGTVPSLKHDNPQIQISWDMGHFHSAWGVSSRMTTWEAGSCKAKTSKPYTLFLCLLWAVPVDRHSVPLTVVQSSFPLVGMKENVSCHCSLA